MYRIKTLNKISPDALKKLAAKGYEVGNDTASPEALLIRSADLHSYDFTPEISCVVRAGAGTNNVPIKACSEKGIVVFNTPGANANAVKELVICALFLSSRDIIGGIEWAKGLVGKGDVMPLVEKGKSQFVGPEISGKTLGVIGLGAIGSIVANAAVSLGMTSLGCDPYISVDGAWSLSRAVEHSPDYDTVFSQSDYISLHIPVTPETRSFLNAETFARMKPGVRIINLARGELVNEDDLIEAMDSGIVSCYVTDFPSERLIAHKNVIALPHLGASTPESEENCATMAVDQVADFLENGNIRNSVNFPEVSAPRAGIARVCLTHRNIPNVLTRATSALSTLGINISNMVNKSRGEYAYTIIDVDSPVGEDVIKNIESLTGTLYIRVLS